MPCLDEESRTMSARLRKGLFGCLIIAIVMSVITTIGVVRSRPVQIAWHRWRMESARKAHYAQPGEDIGNLYGVRLGKEWTRFEEHRSALVELGAVVERRYSFRYLMSPSEESNHLVKRLFEDAPPSIYWESDYPDPPRPLTMTYWCWAENAGKWDEYIAARDVPDYRERFMGEPE